MSDFTSIKRSRKYRSANEVQLHEDGEGQPAKASHLGQGFRHPLSQSCANVPRRNVEVCTKITNVINNVDFAIDVRPLEVFEEVPEPRLSRKKIGLLNGDLGAHVLQELEHGGVSLDEVLHVVVSHRSEEHVVSQNASYNNTRYLSQEDERS